MTDLLAPLPPEPLLAGPNHRRLAFRTLLVAMDITGIVAIVCGFILEEYWVAGALIIGLTSITTVAIVNHKHNHDHIWLLAASTVMTVLLTAYWGVAVFAR